MFEDHANARIMLLCAPAFPPGAMVTSGPTLCHGPYLGLWPYRSQGLCWCMSMAPVTTQGNTIMSGVWDSHQGPCWYLRFMLLLGPYWSEWPTMLHRVMVSSRPHLLRPMSGFLVLLQPWSMLVSVAPLTTKVHVVSEAHTDLSGLYCCPEPWWYLCLSCCWGSHLWL